MNAHLYDARNDGCLCVASESTASSVMIGLWRNHTGSTVRKGACVASPSMAAAEDLDGELKDVTPALDRLHQE